MAANPKGLDRRLGLAREAEILGDVDFNYGRRFLRKQIKRRRLRDGRAHGGDALPRCSQQRHLPRWSPNDPFRSVKLRRSWTRGCARVELSR